MPGGVALLRDERRRAARAHRELGARVGARRRHEAEVTTSAEDPYRGAASLRVGITAPYGWGAQLSGWPGAPTSPGAKRISFWARQGTGAVSAVTVRVKWFDETGALLDASVVPLDGLTTAWQQAVADVTAPPGTATAHVEAYGDSGGAGDSVHLDDVVVADA